VRISARTALAATVIALAASPLAGMAQADDGCVASYLRNDYVAPTKTVVLNPDGSVTINPGPPVGFAGAVAGDAVGLVTCIV
jgi:hypothetical protein